MQRICRPLLGALLMASATPAAADTVKPPIRGLVSMGAFKFVGSGGGPDITLEPRGGQDALGAVAPSMQ